MCSQDQKYPPRGWAGLETGGFCHHTTFSASAPVYTELGWLHGNLMLQKQLSHSKTKFFLSIFEDYTRFVPALIHWLKGPEPGEIWGWTKGIDRNGQLEEGREETTCSHQLSLWVRLVRNCSLRAQHLVSPVGWAGWQPRPWHRYVCVWRSCLTQNLINLLTQVAPAKI